MKWIGIFEAKTRLPGICDEVVASGTPVTVSRRGKPLVVISPIPPQDQADRLDIITAMKSWQSTAGMDGHDFPDVWEERSASAGNPLPGVA